MRRLDKPMVSRLEDGVVNRIQFIKSIDTKQFQGITMRESIDSLASDTQALERFGAGDDFSLDDLDRFRQGRISEIEMSARVSNVSNPRRASDNFGKNLANALNELSFSSENSIAEQAGGFDDQNVNMRRASHKRRSSFMPSPLQRIHEECGDKENHAGMLNTPGEGGTPTSGFAGPRFSSTPATVVKSNRHTPQLAVIETSDEVIDLDAIESDEKEMIDGAVNKQSVSGQTITAPIAHSQSNVDFKKEFGMLHEKIQFEVQSMNLDFNFRHIEMLTHVQNQRRQLQTRIDMIEQCMALLMNDDVKINRIMELQDENRNLSQDLDAVMRRLNP